MIFESSTSGLGGSFIVQTAALKAISEYAPT
jgi:hypothetical protein